MTNATDQIVTRSVISLNEEKGIYKADFQKKQTLSVELRQSVKTVSIYAATKTSNEMNGGLFATADFGIKPKEYENTENRVAWVMVPETATMEQVKAMLAKAIEGGAVIYRVLSFAPIISKDQQYAIDNGLKTLDEFAATQAMRYPENDTTKADGTANTLILDKATGNIVYRKTFFWGTPRQDEDLRDPANVYAPADLLAQVDGAATFSGQEVN